jgi:hypothetical protein
VIQTLLKIGVLNNTQLVLLNTLCVLQQHTLCAKLDDHYILAHLNVCTNVNVNILAHLPFGKTHLSDQRRVIVAHSLNITHLWKRTHLEK